MTDPRTPRLPDAAPDSDSLSFANPTSTFDVQAPKPKQEPEPAPKPAFSAFSFPRRSSERAVSSFFFELRDAADELGIDDFGFAPVSDASTFDVFADAVRRGATAGLPYLEKDVDARRNPRSVLADANTLIVVVLSQRRLREESRAATGELFRSLDALAPTAPRSGSSAFPFGTLVEYAVSLDYHDVLRRALRRLQTFFRERFPNATSRPAVDSAPILEKDWAARAGLGFCGFHSLLIHRRFGSRLFLGELLVSASFEELTGFSTPETFRAAADAPESSRRPLPDAAFCRSCRRCVDACPTGALVGDRTLDARRCLNFWTIENRAEISEEIARKLDGRLFGCDLCQRVCPWNAPDSATSKTVALAAVDALDDAAFRRLFKKTPIFRARLDGLRRVAAALRANEQENGRTKNGEKRDEKTGKKE